VVESEPASLSENRKQRMDRHHEIILMKDEEAIMRRNTWSERLVHILMVFLHVMHIQAVKAWLNEER
jgi:hypothetical protein